MQSMIYSAGSDAALARLGIKTASLIRGLKGAVKPPAIPSAAKKMAPGGADDIFKANANRGAGFEGKVPQAGGSLVPRPTAPTQTLDPTFAKEMGKPGMKLSPNPGKFGPTGAPMPPAKPKVPMLPGGFAI